MTRRDRIVVLLTHYRDVRDGLFEQRNADGVAGTCRAWKHPSYVQLERLRLVLRERFPKYHAHLVAFFVGYWERRVARCSKCGRVESASFIGLTCKHRRGVRSGVFVPAVVRVVPGRSQKVEDAVDWFEEHWRGPCDVPEDVLAIEAERRLRAA